MKHYQTHAFLYPMKDWHLYSDFKNGLPEGGRITFVWLFGIVGIFVLLLACINFMNLSTARSEKRAKEVGIRKSIGSLKRQLVQQFLSESFLVVFLAFIISLLLVLLSLPWFNELADKKIAIPFSNPFFWLFSFAFIIINCFIGWRLSLFLFIGISTGKSFKRSHSLGAICIIAPKGIGGYSIYSVGHFDYRNYRSV